MNGVATANCYEPDELWWHETPTLGGVAMESGWYCGICRGEMDDEEDA